MRSRSSEGSSRNSWSRWRRAGRSLWEACFQRPQPSPPPRLGREPAERLQVLPGPLPFFGRELLPALVVFPDALPLVGGKLLPALQVLLDAGTLLRRQRFEALGRLAHSRAGNGQPDGQHHQQGNAQPPHGFPRSSVRPLRDGRSLRTSPIFRRRSSCRRSSRSRRISRSASIRASIPAPSRPRGVCRSWASAVAGHAAGRPRPATSVKTTYPASRTAPSTPIRTS